MDPSRGRLIAQVFRARLQRLTIANGFTSNAGASVLPIGQISVDPEKDPIPSAIVHPGQITTPEESTGVGLPSGVLTRDVRIEIVEKVLEVDAWFDQSEDLVRDVLQVLMEPSSDPAMNWRSRALGIKGSLRLTGTQVDRPEEGTVHLLVGVTIAVRYVEHFFTT